MDGVNPFRKVLKTNSKKSNSYFQIEPSVYPFVSARKFGCRLENSLPGSQETHPLFLLAQRQNSPQLLQRARSTALVLINCVVMPWIETPEEKELAQLHTF